MALVDDNQQLLAKARALKEKAIATGDRTRRSQLLLIAAEYQKLARFNIAIAQDEVRAVAGSAPPIHIGRGRAARVGAVVTRLRLPSTRAPAANEAPRMRPMARLFGGVEWSQNAALIVWAIVSLALLVLTLEPGDQTMQGLESLFSLFIQ